MAGISDRRPKWYAGKVLGGSSMLNAMLYMRGHRDDYDEWESMGCDGWGYDDALRSRPWGRPGLAISPTAVGGSGRNEAPR